MGCCNGITRHRATPSSSVMLRRLRRLRVTAIFYTCGGLCAILLLVNFNEDVKRLLQQSSYSSAPHLSPSGSSTSLSGGSGGGSHSLTSQQQQSPPSQSLPLQQQLQQQNSLQHHHQQPQQQQQQHSSYRKVPDFPQTFSEVNSNNVINYNGEGSGTDGEKTFDPPATGPSYLLLNDQPDKPWFMWGGTKFPSLSSGVPSTSVDEAKLWYEDNLNNDRIVEQLMFWIDDPINNPNSTWWFEGETTVLSTSTPPVKAETSFKLISGGGSGTGTGSGGSAPANSLGKTTFDDNFLSSVAQSTRGVQVTSGGSFIQNDTMALGGRFPSNQRRGKLKNILLYYGLGMSWGSHITSGRSVFLQQKCPVNACRLTGNRAHLPKADVVLFKDVFMNPKIKRNPSQLWVMYMLECPLNTQNFVDKNVFNMTATYRHDSDIVTPYEKWVYYDETVKTLTQVNYAEGKTKKVAWFVSNCVAKNNRLDYARELAKYIEVDIYGACGTHSCSRANAKQCFDLLAKNYKFYLAFENSNCRDYISEKFFVNGLGNNVLPIVMGAHPDDYKRVAPAKSYIHVDDFASPKELAEYLYLLDSNNDLYNEYFQWKGTGEFINTHFFCRLCAMAHYADKSERKPRHYKDFNKWWRGPHVCTRRSWRNQPDIYSPEYYERQTVDN